MKNFLLQDVRLLHYFLFFFGLYCFILSAMPEVKFEAGALTLFTANSFLFGLYTAPIVGAQKLRIEELHKTVRAEANALFAMAIATKKLPKATRNTLQAMFVDYLKSSIRQRSPAAAEKRYEALISYCLEYDGKQKDAVDSLLDKLVANQINRTNYVMQMGNRVFTNEWVIMIVLFFVSEVFILTIRAGEGVAYDLLAALLCTALSMLLIILVKLSTLTHKKAKEMWNPYQKLVDSNFYRID